MASRASFGAATRLLGASLVAACLLAEPAGGQAPPASPQPASPSPAAAGSFSGSDENLAPDKLQELVAPIALYPDDLLAIVLPASTQPIQIVEAKRLLDTRKSDPNAQPPKSWDPSVISLLNYPEVVELMNQDLTWTEQLGTSVIAQQADLMDSIQNFRKKVEAAGNLKSNDKQTVSVESHTQTIVIESADPQVIYVPSYNPTTVVYAPAPGYPPPYYYSPPYPYYYSPAATFFTGALIGGAIGYAIGWNDHDIYHGDVDINIDNSTNINRTDVRNRLTNVERNDIRGNRENTWRPDKGAVNRAQTRRDSVGGGGSGRAAVNPADIRSGLSQRGGGSSPGARAPGLAERGQGLPGGQHPGIGSGGGDLGHRAGLAGNRPAGAGDRGIQHAAPRGGAFAGAGGGGARANVESQRGNRSLGNASFQSRGGSGGRSAVGAGGGGGRGAVSGGGGRGGGGAARGGGRR